MDTPLAILSLIVFLPALAALLIAFIPSDKVDLIRWVTLAATAIVLVLCAYGFFASDSPTHFDTAARQMQSVFQVDWIPSFDIEYYMGVDGISFPLVMLTALVCLLAMGASWSITKYVKGYCILFLLLETGMLGVFLALDFFLFYVFWEVMLLPMYFLIGVWGGPRKEYAAIKFFLYTLLGSVLMLIAILMLYFAGDLRGLTDEQLIAGKAVPTVSDRMSDEKKVEVLAAQREALEAIRVSARPIHTFNILALQQIGQHTKQFDNFGTYVDKTTKKEKPRLFLGYGMQWWAFVLLFIGFIIKVPSVPLHTWLPDAHVEAPTPISMILAGILLKMGGYGIIRICYPICPHGGYDLAYVVCAIGVISMVYGAFAALAQRDFKRLVAYSSVSHMGYVVLGLGVWSAVKHTAYNPDYWNMGVQGAMFQMIGHGISSAGMFFMVGVIYDRVHHRNLDEFGGLFAKMPVYTALSIGIFFAALGLPGLCGFPGEVFVVLSVWPYKISMAVIAAAVVVLTAAYILWTIQRVYLGPEYKGPHGDHLTPSNARENAIAIVLFVFAILFGVAPYHTVLKYVDKTVEQQVNDLAVWTRDVKQPELDALEAERKAGETAVTQVSTLVGPADAEMNDQ
ncbi:MAG TPA: NADH-quinone oxidoreductase subunit M [Pirellulaceae bacterium]|nr:NADH-quinone oxidoreductase subunit M [Pirellulaceae bacterium]